MCCLEIPFSLWQDNIEKICLVKLILLTPLLMNDYIILSCTLVKSYIRNRNQLMTESFSLYTMNYEYLSYLISKLINMFLLHGLKSAKDLQRAIKEKFDSKLNKNIIKKSFSILLAILLILNCT